MKFYEKIFGTTTMYLQKDFAQVTTPGNHDIIVFELKPHLAGKTGGGITHFGFRLKDPSEMPLIMKRLKAAGVVITDSGEFVKGEPYVFFEDPDGYEVEVWYEKINP